jgi:hypothetical protein
LLLSTTSSRHSARSAMATTAPLLSPHRACPTPLRRNVPPPPLAFDLAAPARLLPRLCFRRAPPPCTAKFGKFDASDAPAEAEETKAAAADGGEAQLTDEDDRSGSLHHSTSSAYCLLINDTKISRVYRLLLCVSAACHRIWRVRFGNRERRARISLTLEACEPSYDPHSLFLSEFNDTRSSCIHCFSVGCLTAPFVLIMHQ